MMSRALGQTGARLLLRRWRHETAIPDNPLGNAVRGYPALLARCWSWACLETTGNNAMRRT